LARQRRWFSACFAAPEFSFAIEQQLAGEGQYFRPWNIDQTLLLPPNVQDFVAKGHVSRFIVELVRESLDLKEITGSYVSGLGQPPFDPRMMVALLLHGYAGAVFVAADRQSLPRTERFCDDCGA
jgi:hypothetical protein